MRYGNWFEKETQKQKIEYMKILCLLFIWYDQEKKSKLKCGNDLTKYSTSNY